MLLELYVHLLDPLQHLKITKVYFKSKQINFENCLPLAGSAYWVSFPNINNSPSLVTSAEVALLQAAWIINLSSTLIIFFGLLGLGCRLALF